MTNYQEMKMAEKFGPHWAAEAAGQMQFNDKLRTCTTLGCERYGVAVVLRVTRCPVCHGELTEVGDGPAAA